MCRTGSLKPARVQLLKPARGEREEEEGVEKKRKIVDSQEEKCSDAFLRLILPRGRTLF